jgi:site-specific recombinase XerD
MLHATALTGLTPRTFTPAQMAAIGYLARYQGGTFDLYARHLREWFAWCEGQNLDPLTGPTRTHVELYTRHRMTDLGNCVSTISNNMSAIKGFFRFAVIDGLIERNPAEHANVPKVHHDESRLLGLDRLELGNFIATARDLSPQHSSLAHLLSFLGLRVSEACAVQIEDFADTERGHRVLHLVGKGNKPATMPLTAPVIGAMELAQGERTAGPLLVKRKDGTQLDRSNAAAMVATICRHAGITKQISPHSLRHSMITNALDAGVPLRDVQIAARHADPRTTVGYDRARENLDRHAIHALTDYLAGAC